jgi:hypothetical protein
MTFACPAAIASRAALDVFAPVIAALSSSWDVFSSSVYSLLNQNKKQRRNISAAALCEQKNLT